MNVELDKIIEQLRWQMSSWNTIHMKVEYDQRDNVNRKNSSITHDYIETRQGKKLYEIRVEYSDGRVARSEGYCDGGRCANVLYSDVEGRENEQHTVFVSKTFMNEHATGYAESPQPLQLFHVGLTPLYEAIEHAEHVGEESVVGRACHVFRFPAVPGRNSAQDLVYYLDQATAIPLKVEAFPIDDASGERRFGWRWEAESVDAVGDYHVPLHSHYTSTRLNTEITVEDIRYNDPYDDSIFWPVIQSGVQVIDSIEDEIYSTPSPGDADAVADAVAVPSREAQAEVPIRVDPPGSWTSTVSSVSLGLGAAVLIASLVLWLRRS